MNRDHMQTLLETMTAIEEDWSTDNRNDKFTQAYITAMLWAETDEHDEPLENNYGTTDFSYESLESIRQDCAKFKAEADLDRVMVGIMNIQGARIQPEDVISRAGHDFWLTRAGHGAGFWDGDWPQNIGDRLTELSKQFHEQDVYVGDDGLLHVT